MNPGKMFTSILVLGYFVCGAAFGQDAWLAGQASYAERIAVKPGAMFEAVLQDISRADTPAVEVGRFKAETDGAPPFEFSIPYDSSLIDPKKTYAVTASVLEEAGPVLSSQTMQLVLTRGAPDHVEIIMKPVTSGRVLIGPRSDMQHSDDPEAEIILAQAEVAETDVEDADEDVEDGKEKEPPRLSGMVAYSENGGLFTDCETGIAFRVAEEGDHEALEHAYVAAGNGPGVLKLASVEGHTEIPGDNDDNAEPLVFIDRFVGIWAERDCESSGSELGLTNSYWKFSKLGMTMLGDDYPAAEPHLVLRSEESRFSATVGCNQIMGSFALNGESLTFGPGAASTLMACEGELSDNEEILGEVLKETRSWDITDDQLQLFDEEGNCIALLTHVPVAE
ncbi:META domain-containing protein [Amaricoccus tamworthensis]|uniref:META domain-containing protein n=1 Tax=Amaricoccus tamworthensis TaxID=57002 RepID=UPI003C7C853F